MNSKNLEWSFQKTTEFFSESCVLWTLLFVGNFHRKFPDCGEPIWTLDWTEFKVAVFWVVEYVTVNSWHVVVFWFVDRLTSRRWLPMSLNDDNRPRTRHQVRWLNGCWSSEGGKSDCSVVVACLWVVKESFWRKIFGSWMLERICSSAVWLFFGSRPRKLQRRSLRQPHGLVQLLFLVCFGSCVFVATAPLRERPKGLSCSEPESLCVGTAFA